MDESITKQIHEALRGQNYKKEMFSEEQIKNCQVALIEGSTNIYNVAVPVYARDFIKNVLIIELGFIIEYSPWLGFLTIGSGIEFLGKCIDRKYPNTWDQSAQSRRNFNEAIENLSCLKKYLQLRNFQGFDMYEEFRCGLTHGMAPKSRVSLSSGNEDRSFVCYGNVVNFNANELYADFKAACEEVINMKFENPNKMNDTKIYVNCRVVLKTQQ